MIARYLQITVRQASLQGKTKSPQKKSQRVERVANQRKVTSESTGSEDLMEAAEKVASATLSLSGLF